ncbi:MAG: DinB family protein [Fimbriimonadaceae bacterium]
MREFLLRGFDYDVWANRKWIEALGRFPDGVEALKVFEHIIGAQRTWLSRCGVFVQQTENVAFSDLAQSYCSTWKMLLEEADLNSEILYQNSVGDEYVSLLGDIAAHVLNHGTYHRGHLRALAEIAGIEFPETDLIAYTRQPQ